MKIFQSFRGHDLLTNETSINGFLKLPQETGIIVEIIFHVEIILHILQIY